MTDIEKAYAAWYENNAEEDVIEEETLFAAGWNASRAALVGEVEPVAAIGTKGYSTQYYLARKNWKEPEGTKDIVWLAPIPDVGTLLYTAEAIGTAVVNERERCAQICDALNFIDNGSPAGIRASNRHCAAAIRGMK